LLQRYNIFFNLQYPHTRKKAALQIPLNKGEKIENFRSAFERYLFFKDSSKPSKVSVEDYNDSKKFVIKP